LLLHTAYCAAAGIPAEVFDGASSEDVVSALQGRKLLGAHRKGKQMWLTFQGDKPNLLMHFGKLTAQGAEPQHVSTSSTLLSSL
jgi:formamidopyrimidine-DNA glycosylase